MKRKRDFHCKKRKSNEVLVFDTFGLSNIDFKPFTYFIKTLMLN